VLEKYRKYIDLAELRVDCLDPDERFSIRRFPEMAGLPLILTIRRENDGGRFVGGEASRVNLLAKGLAYAAADQRRNFAYVDLEEDLNVPSLEEAARAFGTRVIRSWHNLEGIDEDLVGRLRRLRRVGDEIVKIAVKPDSLDDVAKVYHAAKETRDLDKILVCMGNYGVNTRILAEFLGSRISYTSPLAETDLPKGAPGQLDPRELSELYRFRSITTNTKVFAVAGYPLTVAESPRFFNTVFRMEKIDAVFVPIPTDSVNSLMRLVQEIGIAGFSVTTPYKEQILPFLTDKSKEVLSIRACNTVVTGPGGWSGHNTDATGFSDALLSFVGRKDLKGRKVTIIGAGGAAKAATSEVYRLKGKALILNRTTARARSLAEPYGFTWGGLDGRGAELMERFSDIILQASSAGMEPNVNVDPIEFHNFTGKEMVLDFVYQPERTLCLSRAEAAGCRVQNGRDMLHRQARYQYVYFLNKEFPPSLISRVVKDMEGITK